MSRPQVILLRGHSANPWDLRPWEDLAGEFDVRVLVTGSNLFDMSGTRLEVVPVRARRDRLPTGRLGDLVTLGMGDCYENLERHLAAADIVHTAEIDSWFAWQPARLKDRLGFRLVATVWETIPFCDAYRSTRGRRRRVESMPRIDRFFAATQRARQCLLLEGADPERILVSYPGIDRQAFSSDGNAPSRHMIVSPGRLVWEKGHQDVMRALALLDRGVLSGPDMRPHLTIVGSGPERARLQRHAIELGIADRVDWIESVPHKDMPGVFAGASCVVLGSLSTPAWEEQFGMVLAEAMSSGTPVIASSSGAIPEVVGPDAPTFAAGDWQGLATLLAEGPLSRPPAERVRHDPERLARYSAAAAAERLAREYRALLA